MLVVSDTSPISTLFVVGKLNLLRDLFGEVVIPANVFAELSRLKEFGYDLADLENAPWLVVRPARDTTAVKDLSNQLAPGESEAIVLAQEGFVAGGRIGGIEPSANGGASGRVLCVGRFNNNEFR